MNVTEVTWPSNHHRAFGARAETRLRPYTEA
jgi:hypothetical protein